MKYIKTVFLFIFALTFASAARAQEPELVSEIVARINNDIITRADYLEAVRAFREELAQQMRQQGKSDTDIDAEFEKQKDKILDYMIEDLLLEQKARELGLDVEAEVNQQWSEIVKRNNFKSITDFENALRQQGIDPETARTSIRRSIQQQYVIQREVVQPIFMRLSDKDRKDFYDRHKVAFTTKGEVTLSEIFLPLEGHTAADVEQRARRLVAELRAGGLTFVDAVKRNTPSSRATFEKDGKMGTYKPGELKEDVEAAISQLKVGDVTEPIRLPDGYQIIRVDERKPASLRPFDDPEVQQLVNRGVVSERVEEERKKFIKKLRGDAFIEISKGYDSAQAKADKE
jgi:peptidyl-prolyl cis-trans isomerase SurA